MGRDFRILSTFCSGKTMLCLAMLVIIVGSINFPVLASEESPSGSDNKAADPAYNEETPYSNSTASDSQTGNLNSTEHSNDESQSNSNSTTSQTNSSSNQTSTSSDQGQASGNPTDSESDNRWNSAENEEAESYQNDTSHHQDNSNNVQPANNTLSGNMTGTRSENSASYSDDTQIMNENATISSNLNLTDYVAVIQNITALSPPDFDISIAPFTTSVEAGSSTTYTITVSSMNGFNSNVSLSITSHSIIGITSSLSSNMTKPPPNTATTSLLTVLSDPTTESGEYKLRVTALSANMSDSSASVMLEVVGKNVTLDQVEQFDPVALTPVLIKDMQDSIIDNISSNRMVLISTTVNNNYNKTQPFIVVVEVRDEIGTTLYLQLQKGILNPLGEVEVAISWTPDKTGIYQVRTFAIDQLKDDPEPLSAPVGKIVEVK